MPDPCPECGADRVLVGYRHRCVPKRQAEYEESSVRKERAVRHESTAKGERAARSESTANIERSRRGRPRIEDRKKTIEAAAPWKAAKMSRASWYRRQREKKK